MNIEEYAELLGINLRLMQSMQPTYKVGDAFVEMSRKIEEIRLKEIVWVGYKWGNKKELAGS